MQRREAPPPRGLSHDRTALLLVALLAGVVTTLIAVAWLGFEMQSAVRAYVNGESLWTKGQKEATLHLLRYAREGNPGDLARFNAALVINYGDRVAREQLDRAEPDMDLVREGFLLGGNHPDDVDRMAGAYRRLRNVWFVDSAISIWAAADTWIDSLAVTAGDLAAVRPAVAFGADTTMALIARVNAIDRELTVLEREFSGILGAGARWTQRLLTVVVVGIGGVLVTVVGVVTWRAFRRIRAEEEARRASEAVIRDMVERAPFGICRVGRDGTCRTANPALAAMLGYPDVNALLAAGPGAMALTPRDRQRLLDAGTGDRIASAETTWQRRDGSTIPVRLTARLPADAGEHRDDLELFAEDLTAERALGEQLRRSQKMEAVAQLTGGIAHDFNNLLTVITANAEMLAGHPALEDDSTRRNLEELTSATHRGAALVRRLLALGRRDTLRIVPTPLAGMVEDALQLLRRTMPTSIAVHPDVADQLPWVMADAEAMQQVLLNLATNARDALPDGGTIRLIVTADAEAAEITIADDGAGMDDATRMRAFEPFFTTKAAATGSGLGLAMVEALVRQMGGRVRLQTEPDHGTRVTVALRVTASREPDATTRVVPPPSGQGELILLVEDEAALRLVARRVLTAAGYRVREAANGREALERLSEDPAGIDLVLSDLVMPELGGRGLHRMAREAGHHHPFLFMSGYSPGGNEHGADAGVPLLPKPWTVAELLTAVHRRLREHG